MGLGRHLRGSGVLLVCGLLLGGCSGGDTDDRTTPRPAPSGASAGDDAPPVAAESPTEAADPARSPRTAEDARALVRSVIADEQTVGNGARRGTPYESDPATWAVLGEDCGWRRETLPADVLADLRRDFELPGGGDVPGLRLTAEVTVHRTALDAAWEQARMMEEAMACPRQIPRAGEELSDLTSGAYVRGEGYNAFSDDWLIENGRCDSNTSGGPYPYAWMQATFGPVVVSASYCGGSEETKEAAADIVREYFTQMLRGVKARIGRSAPGEGS
ncbi:hypothetical protein RKD23_007140 [Streptomyces sp. SAI-170]|uniref:hypothetical protein n=1 Tax=Streptomyces sp. SAI-170 TaxID=3377729 RepID=UPI003C7B7322